MPRKFQSQRLYKIIRFLVIIITAFCLFMGINLLITNDKSEANFLNDFDICTKENYGKNSMDICGFYLDEINYVQKVMGIYLAIGIFLPIVFFGSVALFNYLFPKTLILHSPKKPDDKYLADKS